MLTPFLRSLTIDVSQGLLVIVDGGKGLRAAVRQAFRRSCLLQTAARGARSELRLVAEDDEWAIEDKFGAGGVSLRDALKRERTNDSGSSS